MPRQLVNREEQGISIVQTSGTVSMIDESYYKIRSTSGNNTYVNATESGWVCSCPDYAWCNVKCKHTYAVEFYRSQSATF